REQKFASYRAFLAYMMAHPGKKLLFMGQEFAQENEWNYQTQLDWNLVKKSPEHKIMLKYSQKLNKFYSENSPLWQNDDSWNGFSWISNDDNKQSIIAFRRIDDNDEEIIAVCNFVPVARQEYKIGVPKKGRYKLVFNTDATEFGGSGITQKSFRTEKTAMHGFEQCISMTLAPLSVIYLKYAPVKKRTPKVSEDTSAETTVKETSTAKSSGTVKKSETSAKKKSAKAE
ncbi:MAG: alpha amylase C-terminal domain-containing protein, partial [Ruminococcus sp.]|nr:alpha amylase C-terminal domain-containing protein [Ruminococcus sp.]